MSIIGSSTSKPVTSAPPAAAETRSAAVGEPSRSVWSSLREAGSELWQRVQDRFRTTFSRDQYQAGGQNPSESRAVNDFTAAAKKPGGEQSAAGALNPDRIPRAVDIGTQMGWINDATKTATNDVASKVMGVQPGQTATGAARQIGFEEIRNQLTGYVSPDQLDQRLSKIGSANIDGAMKYINQAQDGEAQQARISQALQALVTMERDPRLFVATVHSKNIIQTPVTMDKTTSPSLPRTNIPH